MADKKLNIKVRTQGAKRAKKDLKGVESGIAKMGKAAAIAATAFFGAKKLIAGIQKTVELAAKLEGVERGFINLTKSAKFSAQTFDKLQKATDGTINSIELMTQANNAMLLGIFESEDQMASMFDTAQRLAKALGKDTRFGIESLVTGMGRQSKLMLDNLGIMVKTEDAYEQFALSLGVTTSELTDQQRKQAFVNATMKEANRLVSTLGEEQLTTADASKQFSAAVDELSISIGKGFSPSVETGTKVLTEFIKKAGETDWDLTFSSLKIQLMAISPHFAALAGGLDAAARKIEEAKKAGEGPQESPFPTPEEMIELMGIEAQTLEIRREGLAVLAPQPVIYKEINSNAEKLKEWSAQTSSSLATSALMGDNVTESLKRAVIQLMIMVAQAKIYAAIMAAATPGGWIASIGSFLFGASPTQVAPSASAAAGSKIVINNNISGFGTIDSNFASNSLIPAINKAISTGQARLG